MVLGLMTRHRDGDVRRPPYAALTTRCARWAPSSRPPSTRPHRAATTCECSATPRASRSPRRRRLDMVGLADAGKRRGYSLGMRQRLASRPRCWATPRSWCSTSRPTASIRKGSSGCGLAPGWPTRGPHGAGLQPSAGRNGARRRPGHPGRRAAGPAGHDGAVALGRRRRGHGARPGAGDGAGSPRCSVPAARSVSQQDGVLHRQRQHAGGDRSPRLRRRHRAARTAAAHQRPRGDLLPAHQRRRSSSLLSPPGRPLPQETTR